MIEQLSFKRLILRAVLRHVSPMVIRHVAVSDQMNLPEFNDIFCAVLGWSDNLGYIFRVHAREFNSFRRKTRSSALHEFRLHRQEKFLYICDTLHMWEWEVQVLDIQEGTKADEEPACLGGRGATPPEFCGGPTGYRLMLKRQSEGKAMLAPAMVETAILMLAEACPDQAFQTWDLRRTAMDDGLRNIDRRLNESGPLERSASACRKPMSD
jgi:Plasmid pRiA4b ORF-3-like protein